MNIGDRRGEGKKGMKRRRRSGSEECGRRRGIEERNISIR
jgi:hypothetical protein